MLQARNKQSSQKPGMSEVQGKCQSNPDSIFGIEISVPDLPMSLQEALALRPGMHIQIEAEEPLRTVLKVDGVGIASGLLKLVDGKISILISEISY